jgi:hypothetical protein
MKAKWAISTEIFEKPGYPKLRTALEKAGIEYFHSDFDKHTRQYADIPYGIVDECVVMYGPIQFIRTKNRGFIPGPFGFKKDTDTSFYMNQLPSNHFFNDHVVYLPFGMITKHKYMLQDIFGDHIFIRPDSGFKSFTGFAVKIKDLDFELSSLKQTKNPFSNEMCMISRAKNIQSEYRLIVCNRKVITGSQYRWDNKMDVRIDVHSDAWKFAEDVVAAAEWQLDTCYCVDIFIGDDGPKIGEFNSFSSCGLYNCDLDIIVEEVSKAALSEWQHG